MNPQPGRASLAALLNLFSELDLMRDVDTRAIRAVALTSSKLKSSKSDTTQALLNWSDPVRIVAGHYTSGSSAGINKPDNQLAHHT